MRVLPAFKRTRRPLLILAFAAVIYLIANRSMALSAYSPSPEKTPLMHPNNASEVLYVEIKEISV
jgi:hypothetical protein